ncbi:MULTISPECIES: FAD-dependent monooxygenase [Rhodopseudomonas]|uniref:Monooxygenase n=1 Tax=Rhodopseudomonas palustris TaxID=1076 RepID=A0A0D7EYK7_RHOPL|nr:MULTISPECIES: FAD-dependent monooxygenase [Rhodopseudomonas]KIZ45660.1 monooxygenase [Rhodopseudomonas palustris]MDF3810935.1 FAD-dependent monooxygenase [Rhodopseudomonas sp. BAL398]WOK19638.1 FAD-dependent monooxygenase [Rhodopseudomonas sp. BAL398]
MATSRPIVVAGAGIGGLTAALALAANGFRVIVLEKAERLEEAGAGLQLSPNASRVLIDLNLMPRLAPRAIVPESVAMMSARSGGELVRLPLGDAATARAGAPYWVIHRADLQAALQAQVNATPAIELRLGHCFEDASSHAEGMLVGHRRHAVRRQDSALALIGADGIWSNVRGQLFPAAQPSFSGLIAWRGTIDANQMPRGFPAGGVQLWMGSNAHLVTYPISAGRQINIVAIVPDSWNRPGWSAPGEAVEIQSRFPATRWPAAARMMVGAVGSWRRWALFAMPDDGVWSHGATALLGDAAHGMLPFAAQGAGMAIEDAAVLAKCLAQSHGPSAGGDAVAAALQRYGQLRKARVGRVQRTARQNGLIYHLGGPAALARDLVMKQLGGARLLARQDWIYDWRV